MHVSNKKPSLILDRIDDSNSISGGRTGDNFARQASVSMHARVMSTRNVLPSDNAKGGFGNGGRRDSVLSGLRGSAMLSSGASGTQGGFGAQSQYGRSSTGSFMSLSRSVTKIMDKRSSNQSRVFLQKLGTRHAKKEFKPAASDSSSSVRLQRKKKTTFMSALKRAESRTVFASTNFKAKAEDTNKAKISAEEMANYQIVEKVTDKNNLLVYTMMQNSDLIYFNRMQGIFKTELYTQDVKKQHLERIRRNLRFENLIKQKECERCTNPFKSYLGGLFSNKEYCEFCMNYVCKDCIYTGPEDKAYFDPKNIQFRAIFSKKTEALDNLERAERLKQALFYPRSICKQYHKELEGYKYMQIDSRNPFLLQD